MDWIDYNLKTHALMESCREYETSDTAVVVSVLHLTDDRKSAKATTAMGGDRNLCLTGVEDIIINLVRRERHPFLILLSFIARMIRDICMGRRTEQDAQS